MEIDFDKKCLVTLLSLPKMGKVTARRFIDSIRKNILTPAELKDCLDSFCIENKKPYYDKYQIDEAMRYAEEIVQKSDSMSIRLISVFDAEYPTILKYIDDYPLILNVKGDISKLNKMTGVAIIGTREPTDFGFKSAKKIAATLAEKGFNVVSGLAKGCDTAAHTGALSAGGVTTAVLANGLEKVYPAENKKLAQKILDNGGILISEYFIGTKIFQNFFIERDRIQAGLSKSVIVIETDIKGGTMHTVGFCLKYKRILSCLSHPPSHQNEPKVQGNLMLIREGKAFPVADKDGVSDLIAKLAVQTFPISQPPSEQKVNKHQKNAPDIKPEQLKFDL